MVEKWDPVLAPGSPGTSETPGAPRTQGPPVHQDPMDHRDPPDLWTLGPSGTSGH